MYILNSKTMVVKIFPLNNYSNCRVEMLKFLCGEEITVIDNLVVKQRKKLKMISTIANHYFD